jgi:hypothetical protein
MLTRLYNFFSSVKLAVVLLALGLILVFWGTIAQVKLGLYQAQDEFFRSLFIYVKPEGSGLKIPIFPGGYLVGGLLLINLFTAHLRYYKSGFKRLGIAMIHLGVVLLLLGQFATDMLSVESHMSIREGESSNYSESSSRWELVIIDAADPKEDKVIAIPGSLLQKGAELVHPEMPFKLRPTKYHINSALSATNESEAYEAAVAENPTGRKIWWRSLPKETRMNFRDIPSGIVELVGPQGESRSVLVSGYLTRPTTVTAGGQELQLVLRPERYYKPYFLHLIDFRFDRYPGTEKAKNFSSRIRLERPDTGENRELTIRMNEPLRYDGKTFFQSSFDKETEQTTVLQVVNNPGWLTPYFACVLVAIGMTWQFLVHLIGFAAKRKTA